MKTFYFLAIINGPFWYENVWRQFEDYHGNPDWRFKFLFHPSNAEVAARASQWVKDRCIETDLVVTWGSYELALCMIRLARNAIADKTCAVGLFISETCLPVRVPEDYLTTFEADPRSRLKLMYPQICNGCLSSPKRLAKIWHKLKVPDGHRILSLTPRTVAKASQWCLLTKVHLELICALESAVSMFEEWDIRQPDEIVIPTLLLQQGQFVPVDITKLGHYKPRKRYRLRRYHDVRFIGHDHVIGSTISGGLPTLPAEYCRNDGYLLPRWENCKPSAFIDSGSVCSCAPTAVFPRSVDIPKPSYPTFTPQDVHVALALGAFNARKFVVADLTVGTWREIVDKGTHMYLTGSKATVKCCETKDIG